MYVDYATQELQRLYEENARLDELLDDNTTRLRDVRSRIVELEKRLAREFQYGKRQLKWSCSQVPAKSASPLSWS